MPTIVTIEMGGTGATHAAGAREALSVPSMTEMGSSYAQANAAYGQANSARSDANTTFATVNTTFATLNTSAGTQNTNIGLAYDQANTARGQANTAYGQANAAYGQANAAYGAANNRLLSTGGTLSGDLIITGNLTVSGNQTILNTEVLTTEDAEIILLSNTSGTPALNAGLIINRGTSTNTFLRWNEAVDEWGWSDSGTTTYYFEDLRSGLVTTNTTFGTVNTTFGTTNTTFGTVNTTFATLNTSAGTQNTAITNAHDQANSARGQANTAYGQANLAYAQANSARSDANTTFATINTTFGTTNTTFATINTTFGTSNTATNNRVLKAGDTMTGNLTVSGASITISGSSNDQRIIDADTATASGRHVAFPLRYFIGSSAGNYPFAGYNAIPRANGAYSYLTADTSWGITYGSGNRMGFNYAASGTAGANISFSELMSVTSGGSVGIGTTSPSEKLHVSGNVRIGAGGDIVEAADVLYFNLYNGPSEGGGTNVGPSITWKPTYTAYTKRSAGIAQIAEGNFFRSGLAFYTNNTQDTSTDWSERVRISAAGNVGIGTTSPGEKLQVQGNILVPLGGQVLVENPGSGRRGIFATDSTGTYVSSHNGFGEPLTLSAPDSTAYMAFRTAGAERIRLTSAGNVGIGTTNPQGKLTVSNAGAEGIEFFTTGGVGGGPYFNAYNRSAGRYVPFTYYANTHTFYTNTGSTRAVDIDAAGNVGIGTASPSSKLHIHGGDVYLVNPSSNPRVVIGDGLGGGEWGSLQWDSANDLLQLGMGPSSFSPVITINESLNVGIGTTNPGSYKLNVQGDQYISGTLTEASSVTLKENINPISNALNSILNLTGVTYDRKDGSAINRAGLIAEEVEQVLPNIIQKDKEGNPSGIQYTNLIAYLVESIKELKTEIDNLKNK